MPVGTLFVVGTPIGNQADLTERASETLKRVDRIFCENTRVSQKLVSALGIKTPVEPYHENSGSLGLSRALEFLESGESLALVTDSGTPSIADSGSQLVAAVRQRFGQQAKVIPVPGISPVTAILSVSGFSAERFVFWGYPPIASGRQNFFRELSQERRTAVIYEASANIEATLKDLDRVAPDRPLVLGRELTTIFEDVVSGDAASLLHWLKSGPNRTRGEFVLAIGPL